MTALRDWRRTVGLGLLWGLWTAGGLLLVMLASWQGWFFRATGLPPMTWNGHDLTSLVSQQMHVSGALLPVVLLALACGTGLLLFLLAAWLDPQRQALASLSWAARSGRAWLVAVLVLLAAVWSLSCSLPLVALLEVLAWLLTPLWSWLVLHPAVAAPRRAGPLWPLPAAGLHIAGWWLLLFLIGAGIDQITWVGPILAIVLRALECHWLMQRGRAGPRLGIGELALALLRWKRMSPWLGQCCWLIIGSSFLLGPVLATTAFAEYEARSLRVMADDAGLPLPWLIETWLAVAATVASYWWTVAGATLVAASAWTVFAEGRLAHLQWPEIDAGHLKSPE